MISLKKLILENYQLAKKLYIDTHILSKEEEDFIYDLCNGDYTYKTLCDLYLEDKQSHDHWRENDWKSAVVQLRNYHGRVFPIEDFNFDSNKPTITKDILKHRQHILAIIYSWPSYARRNLKQDISQPRNSREFYKLNDLIIYIDKHLRYLDNRSKEQKEKILRKIFNSSRQSFDDVLDFVEDKNNLFTDKTFSKEELYELVKENDYDLKIVYDKNNIVIVDVTGQPGIKIIGCNSVWCFTYGTEYGPAGEQWDRYSYNGHVYAIINFNVGQNDPTFIHIITKPLDYYGDDAEYDRTEIYDMANDMVFGNPKDIVLGLVHNDQEALKVFRFEDF
jgi:hypothetical protein